MAQAGDSILEAPVETGNTQIFCLAEHRLRASRVVKLRNSEMGMYVRIRRAWIRNSDLERTRIQ